MRGMIHDIRVCDFSNTIFEIYFKGSLCLHYVLFNLNPAIKCAEKEKMPSLYLMIYTPLVL